MTGEGVDTSHFQGYISPGSAACLRAQGYSFWIVGTQREDACRAQIQVAQDAGFALGAYLWAHPSWGSGGVAVVRALARCGGYPVRFLALDVEEEGNNYSREWPRWVAEAVAACEAAGVLCVIYTSESMWRKLMANTWAYSHLLLWAASYGSPPRPFGGWTRYAIWQYAGTVEMCGTAVDLNRVPA